MKLNMIQDKRTPDEIAFAQSKHEQTHADLSRVLQRSYNRGCADCQAISPSWAVLPHGIFVCHHCAQVHRGLGRDISIVKEVTTKTFLWHSDEYQAVARTGNLRANRIFSGAPNAPRKPAATAPKFERENYIRNKYQQLEWFVAPTGKELEWFRSPPSGPSERLKTSHEVKTPLATSEVSPSHAVNTSMETPEAEPSDAVNKAMDSAVNKAASDVNPSHTVNTSMETSEAEPSDAVNKAMETSEVKPSHAVNTSMKTSEAEPSHAVNKATDSAVKKAMATSEVSTPCAQPAPMEESEACVAEVQQVPHSGETPTKADSEPFLQTVMQGMENVLTFMQDMERVLTGIMQDMVLRNNPSGANLVEEMQHLKLQNERMGQIRKVVDQIEAAKAKVAKVAAILVRRSTRTGDSDPLPQRLDSDSPTFEEMQELKLQSDSKRIGQIRKVVEIGALEVAKAKVAKVAAILAQRSTLLASGAGDSDPSHGLLPQRLDSDSPTASMNALESAKPTAAVTPPGSSRAGDLANLQEALSAQPASLTNERLMQVQAETETSRKQVEQQRHEQDAELEAREAQSRFASGDNRGQHQLDCATALVPGG